MSYCINPNCPQPQNTRQPLFCQACGSELLLEGCYRVIQPMGGGGFGKTYEVDDSGTAKVLKVLFNTHPKAIELFKQEAEVLKRLNHSGIPKVESDGYFTYSPRNNQEPMHCMVMEKIEGMNLEEYLTQRNNEPIGERAAVRWLKQLAEILHKVHQQQYFHRDIKPPNIMLRPSGQLVLIDFGTAREVTQTFIHKVAGQQVTGIISAGYTPREQMNGKAVPQSDFFALGRTFVYLLTGKSPDDFPEDSRTGELIWRDNAAGISQKLLGFIDYLMAPFPGNRPKDTQEILQKIAEFETSSPDLKKPTQNNQSAYFGQSSQTLITVSYAGFWKRFFAYLIDVFILTIGIALIWKILLSSANILPAYIINEYGTFVFAFFCTCFSTLGEPFGLIYIIGYFLTIGGNTVLDVIGSIIVLSALILKWFYFSWFESSTQQATLGKRALGIIVSDTNGNKLTFGQASTRYWSKTISSLILLIGFIMVGFNEKKQALHDKIAKTLVIKK